MNIEFHLSQFYQKSQAWNIQDLERVGNCIHFHCHDGMNGTFSLENGCVTWHKQNFVRKTPT